MAEGAALEMPYTGNCIVGSNPTLSAIQSSAKSGLPSCSEGEELLICYQFPASQWKSLRTTNAIERMHAEFRRRVKTEGACHTA